MDEDRNILTEHSANDCSTLAFYELNWNSAVCRTNVSMRLERARSTDQKYHPRIKYIARTKLLAIANFIAKNAIGNILRPWRAAKSGRHIYVPFSINYILITRECTVRRPWEIYGIFFYADSAARPVIRIGYFGFSTILGSFSRREPVASWYSNIQMLKKTAMLFFFASRETAARAIRYVMKTPSRNLYDFASSFVERVTRIYVLSFRSCVPVTWRLWD